MNLNLRIPPKGQEDKETKETSIFFRIWFGLNMKEFGKIFMGSIAAAFAGISKPVFGYFIVTIGVTYYHPKAEQKVGWYALVFSAIGLLSLFAHTVQHYLFGVVGERATTNLRQALYSGIILLILLHRPFHEPCIFYIFIFFQKKKL